VGYTVPLGGALTYNPAANVSGIYVLDDSLDEENEDENEEIEDKTSLSENIQEKNSLITKNIVKIKKFKDILNMNDNQFEQFLQKIEQSVASVTTEESQAKSLGLIFKEALTEQGATWKSQVQAEKDAKEKIESDLKSLQDSFATTKEELDKVKLELETKAAVDIFNSRMNFLEDKFSFSEKELEFVTAEVKSLGQEENEFDSYKEKVTTLFSHKLKEAIASTEKEIADKIEAEVAKRLQTSTASTATQTTETETETEIVTEEAEAAIVNNNGESSIQETLVQKLKKNFSVEISQ
jgi:chromosome segregation ATPase